MVYAGSLTVKVVLALLFKNVPLGMNWALTECFPKKYALPPGFGDFATHTTASPMLPVVGGR